MSRCQLSLRPSLRARPFAGAALLLALSALPARAGDGTVAGWVGTTGGDPVRGAVVSLFAAARGSFTAVSGDDGRFSVDLPVGRYTVRALADGFLPAAIRRVTAATGRPLLLQIELEAAVLSAAAPRDADAVRELEWLVRHKKRSVLEGRLPGTVVDDAALATSTPLGGESWLMGGAALGAGAEEATGASLVAFRGMLLDRHWSAQAALPTAHGAWHVSGELRSPEWRAAGAYSARDHRGALLAERRWHLSPVVVTAASLRYTAQPDLSIESLTPSGEIEVAGRVRVRSIARTLGPGGDPLSRHGLPAVGVTAPAEAAWAARSERRHDVRLRQRWGVSTVGVQAFDETSAADGLPGRLRTQGAGVVLGAAWRQTVTGAVTFTRGRRSLMDDDGALGFRSFDEVMARLEAHVDRSDTRVSAYYRVHRPEGEKAVRRFDVQVQQPLPFLNGVARSRWELLLGLRNLVYEATETGNTAEIASAESPTRVVAGISIQF